MATPIDLSTASVVLEVEADLAQYAAARRRGAVVHPWDDLVKRTWSKVFQMSASYEQLGTMPAVPDSLLTELAGMTSQRGMAVRILAYARVTIVGHLEHLPEEDERLHDNVNRFLETPSGQARKRAIEDSTGGEARLE